MPSQIEELVELARTRDLVRSGAAKQIRQEAGLSLGEMAAAIGVGVSTLHRWEGHTRIPQGDAALRYGRALRRLMARQEVAL